MSRASNRRRPSSAARLGPLLAAGLLFALGCEEAPEPQARPRPTHQEGREIYRRHCALCHGRDGQGYVADNAPALSGQAFLSTASDAFLRTAIEGGRPGTPMSAWAARAGGPLRPTQVQLLLRYIRSWQTGPTLDVDSIAVPGNPLRGHAVFTLECSGCHGARGEGVDAIGLGNRALLQSASDGFLRYAVEHGRPGTPMPAFAGRLSGPQMDDVIAYVRSLENPPPLAAAGLGATEMLEPGMEATAEELPSLDDLPSLDELPIVLNPEGTAPEWTLREGRFVAAAEVQESLQAGASMVVLDARATSDWLRSRIPGALPVPFYNMSDIVEHLPGQDTWIVAYCACPHAASGRVVDALRREGFERAVVLDEGILHWEQAGYPITSGLPEQVSPAPLTP